MTKKKKLFRSLVQAEIRLAVANGEINRLKKELRESEWKLKAAKDAYVSNMYSVCSKKIPNDMGGILELSLLKVNLARDFDVEISWRTEVE